VRGQAVRLRHLAQTPLQPVCRTLECNQGLLLQAVEGFGLLDLRVNAFRYLPHNSRYNDYCQTPDFEATARNHVSIRPYGAESWVGIPSPAVGIQSFN
jgi:hypothetical protein